MTDILKKILATKVEEIKQRSSVRPLAELKHACKVTDTPREFAQAIENEIAAGNPAVICEIKKASPSKGIIRENFDPAAIAKSYADFGATCLSVLTDEQYFQGHDDFLGLARNSCNLPAIRKDFIIDPYQVYEARLIGADAVLLIVAALGDSTMVELNGLAQDLGMDVLIEVHDEHELQRALRLNSRLIGINNRNLRTFETTLDTTLDLLLQIPDEKIIITESGIHTPEDVSLMRMNNVNGFLVGEAFMRSPEPGEKFKQLFHSQMLQ